MKVLFLKTLSNKGNEGDVKEISDGFARNFLIPQKIARRVTHKEVSFIINRKKIIDRKTEQEKSQSLELSKKISELKFDIKAKMNENGTLFGSVSLDEILSRLKQQGFMFKRNQISLYKPLKEIGAHTVAIDLGNGVKTHFKVNIIGN